MSRLRARVSSTVFASLVAVAAPPMVLAQLLREGVEFQVNSHTSDSQARPAAAMRAGGAFVVSWDSNAQDGANYGVFGQRFDAAGARQGVEAQINLHTSGFQAGPSVAIAGDGRFIVAWASGNQDGSLEGIFARRFDSAGSALGAELQVNTITVDAQSRPAVAVDGDGDFVVVWDSYDQDGYYYGIFGRRFASTGTALAVEFQVNAYTLGGQYLSALAMDGAGNFVVTWDELSPRDSSYGTFARRFASDGAALGADFQVNVHTLGSQFGAQVAMHGDGSFVIAWSDNRNVGNFEVLARRWDSAGAAVASEFLVNAYTPGDQFLGAIAPARDGSFVVVWSRGYAGQVEVAARAFGGNGAPITPELQVNTYTNTTPVQIAAASDGGRRFVVAWKSGDVLHPQDGSSSGVLAQRLALLATLDVDGDGATTPLTDGLLVLRFMFGFTGPTLTAGAVGPACTRCSAAQIEGYLQGLS